MRENIFECRSLVWCLSPCLSLSLSLSLPLCLLETIPAQTDSLCLSLARKDSNHRHTDTPKESSHSILVQVRTCTRLADFSTMSKFGMSRRVFSSSVSSSNTSTNAAATISGDESICGCTCILHSNTCHMLSYQKANPSEKVREIEREQGGARNREPGRKMHTHTHTHTHTHVYTQTHSMNSQKK